MCTPLGIRHEDKYRQERRTPLTPGAIRQLIERHGLPFVVESSDQRVFADCEYLAAGAQVKTDLDACPVIFGVKEIPVHSLKRDKTYFFFSHVTKGQPYNMPMLKRMMELGCSHIDYERIVDDCNRRVIFFGRYAGIAGMIDSLWSAGERFRHAGHVTPLSGIRQTYRYGSLHEAKASVAAAGRRIVDEGLPETLCPFTIGITGYGNVSKGVQEIAELLPLQWVSPETLLGLNASGAWNRHAVYATIFEERHLVRRNDGGGFVLQEYYQNPQVHHAVFERYLPCLTFLMNCIYWDPRYPRIVTREGIRRLFRDGSAKLAVIGDITCDPGGSIEITHRCTTIEDPVYVIHPQTLQSRPGFEGEGVLVMAVDILPSELPRDASEAFSDALCPFVPAVAEADFRKPLDELGLPEPLRNALVLHRGKLTPEYRYLERCLAG